MVADSSINSMYTPLDTAPSNSMLLPIDSSPFIPIPPTHHHTATPAKRHVYTQDQRIMLEVSFHKDRPWTEEDLKWLGGFTGLSHKTMRTWWSRRANRRQQRAANNLTDDQTMALSIAYHRDGREDIPMEDRQRLSSQLLIPRRRIMEWMSNHQECTCREGGAKRPRRE